MNRPHRCPPITGLILAGGRSTRFGADKALHRIEGRAMINRVYDVLSDLASPILISVADTDTQYSPPARHIVDRFPNSGPLAGLHAGLIEAETEWVLAVAVDLPFITKGSLEMLIRSVVPGVDAVVGRSEQNTQPLCGCYRSSLADAIEKRVASGNLAVKAFLDTIRVVIVDLPASDLRNLNRPEDIPTAASRGDAPARTHRH